MCRFGGGSDWINLVVNIDNHLTIKGNMDGGTVCQNAKNHLAAIRPSDHAVYSNADNDTEIRFNQTTINQ